MTENPGADDTARATQTESANDEARRDSAQQPPKRRALPVSVDPGFRRVIADHAVVMHLGRDTDIAFLAAGGGIQEIEGLFTDADDLPPRVRARPQLNEVVRVRMAPFGAVSAAMEILQKLTLAGLVNVDEVIKTIEEMRALEPAQDDAGEDS